VRLELELGLLSQVEAIRRLNPELQTDAAAVDRLLSIRKTSEIIESGGEETPVEVGAISVSLPGADSAPASATALNGAQVTAAQGIVIAVASGELPRGTGIQMLSSFFNLPIALAESIMGTVGSTFSQPSPEAPNGNRSE
jgi:hypothetical protein